MSPTDPRHATEAGYFAHRTDSEKPCDACKYAHTRAEKVRELKRLSGEGNLVSPVGAVRRLQALARLGYDARRLGREVGVARETIRGWLCKPRVGMQPETAQKISDLYDRLSMRLPVAENPNAQAAITRARSIAERKGWPPPLAWDDIDDPNEKPVGWEYRPAKRRDLLLDLDDRGAGLTEAMRALKVTEDALWKWCKENGMSATYRRLVIRSNPDRGQNQYTREAS